RVGDAAVGGAGHGLGERHARDLELFGFLGRLLAVRQLLRDENEADLVRDGIRRMQREQRPPVVRNEAGFLAQLTLCGGERVVVERSAAHRQLPEVRVERVAILAHEINVILVVDRDDGNGTIFETYFTVLAGAARRIQNFVVLHAYPWIIVYGAPHESFPRVAALFGVGWCEPGHRGSVRCRRQRPGVAMRRRFGAAQVSHRSRFVQVPSGMIPPRHRAAKEARRMSIKRVSLTAAAGLAVTLLASACTTLDPYTREEQAARAQRQ